MNNFDCSTIPTSRYDFIFNKFIVKLNKWELFLINILHGVAFLNVLTPEGIVCVWDYRFEPYSRQACMVKILVLLSIDWFKESFRNLTILSNIWFLSFCELAMVPKSAIKKKNQKWRKLNGINNDAIKFRIFIDTFYEL